MNFTQEELYKPSRGVLIFDVKKTGLSNDLLNLAQELISQMDYPVVFWMNSQLDKNYACNHQINNNQFWITVKEGTTSDERDRIIIKNLYMGVQRRKRYKRISLKKEAHYSKRGHDYYRLAGIIYNMSINLECDLFISKYGLSTIDYVTLMGFNIMCNTLSKHIKASSKNHVTISKVDLFCYAIKCAFYSRKNTNYKKRIERIISNLKPYVESLKMMKLIKMIICLMDEAKMEYNGDNGEEIVNNLQQQFINLFSLNNMIECVNFDAFQEHKIVKGKSIGLFTFVPEECENEPLMTKSFRYVNECLGFFRHFSDSKTYLSNNYVDVAVSFDGEDNFSCMLRKNTGNKKQYYILIFENFVSKIWHSISEMHLSINMESIQQSSDSYVREKLFKYVLYYITLHELGHIMNGDCDTENNNDDYRAIQIREHNADVFANKYLECTVMGSYDRDYSFFEYKKKLKEDSELCNAAKRIAISFKNLPQSKD